MKKEDQGTILQPMLHTCGIILSEDIQKMGVGQLKDTGWMQPMERLLHNLVESYGMYHFAVNLPPDTEHDVISLMKKNMDEYNEEQQEVSLYLVGETEIQGIRYGQDRQTIEKGLFPYYAPPVTKDNLPLREKRIVDYSDHIMLPLPGDEEELEKGMLLDIIEYAKEQNKTIVKINAETLQVKVILKIKRPI